MEKRFQLTEVRAVKNGDKRTITGYAARYNLLSGDLGGFRERIASGAFKRILATNPDVVCLFNHSDNAVLGRTTAGTLRLSEDSRGLKFECDLPGTTAGRDTYESVQRGDLNGCSFAFMVDDARMCEYKEEEIDDEEDAMRGMVKGQRAPSSARSATLQTSSTFPLLLTFLTFSLQEVFLRGVILFQLDFCFMRKDLRFRLRSFEFRRCGKVDKKDRRSLKICSRPT